MSGGRILVPLVGAAIACNAIVGVDDVVLKEGATSTSSSSASSSGGQGDDDDDLPLTPVNPRDAGPGKDSGGVLPECNGVVDCERLVFVTRAVFNGNLGGVAGADAKCGTAAKAIPGYGGRAFRAWLSDSKTSIGNRIAKSTKPYRRVDGFVVASSFTDLTDGTLEARVVDEQGAALMGSELERSVWTSSTPAGQYNGAGCTDWTSADVLASGGYGDALETNATWTQKGTAEEPTVSSCNAERHLYCIEF